MASRIEGRPRQALMFLWRQMRHASTEGPFLYRYKAKRITWRKRHYNEVLIMADRRKLLETLQDIIDFRGKEFPTAFWEVLAKRCLKSMHLFEPLELSILARAFDRPDMAGSRRDVFGPMAAQVLASRHVVPGPAVTVFAKILPRRLKEDNARDLLKFLARRAAEVMWEIPMHNAVALLEELSKAGEQDSALCRRVAAKIGALLPSEYYFIEQNDAALPGRAALAFAAQGHRNLLLFQHLADVALKHLQGSQPAIDSVQSAQKVLDSMEQLDIETHEASSLRSALE
ncbi:Erythronolide synthase, partial [Durusdinium trenchii]